MKEDIEEYLAREEYISKLEYDLWLEGKCICGIPERRCKCCGWGDVTLKFIEMDWL